MEFAGEQPAVDLTYSDVFLVPRRSAVTSRLQVDLAPQDGTPATLPLVASNMNSVTGPRLAAVLARRGGLGVLPQDLPLQDLDAAIRDVKSQPVLWDTPLVLPPAFGLRGVAKETYTAEGTVSYWNAYVAVTQMHGQGSFADERLGVRIVREPDLVTPKLPALRAYQLSLEAPPPPAGSFDPAAAERR